MPAPSTSSSPREEPSTSEQAHTGQHLTSQHLTSRVRADGRVELALVESQVGPPGPDEVVIRVEATPVNPSDVGLLLAGADPATARREGDRTVLDLPSGAVEGLQVRLGQALPVGNEGAGTVVAAGERATDLLGRVVACVGGGMWAQHRLVRAADCLVLAPGTRARDAASAFVNPLTALGLLQTARRDGHTALVHTGAASNLGQMLVRLCRSEDVGLVNVVRSAQQVQLLRSLGAEHICDSTADGFEEQLLEAVAATSATVAFDAVGGGPLAGQVLVAMEAALRRGMTTYSPYGSPVLKQVHVYGRLDPRPLEVELRIGQFWQVGGWNLIPFLAGLDPEGAQRLRDRVAAELTTTFASTYGAEVTLADAVVPDVIARYSRGGTGNKHLIIPA